MKILSKFIKTIDSQRNVLFAVLAGVAFTLVLDLFFPIPAYADAMGDFVNSWFLDVFVGWSNDLLEKTISVCNIFTMNDALHAPFNAITTNGTGESSAYNVISALKTSIIVLGQSILSFALLLQLVKIAQRVDGSATLPMVKEIVMLAIFFVVFSYLVNHSFDICTAAYNEISKVIGNFLSSASSTDISNLKFGEDTEMTFLGFLGIVLACIIMFLFSLIATAVAYALVLARGIQLYVMAACSPIPFALLAFDETRQMGIGFCKNFVSVCLAGLIIACLVTIYPSLIVDAINGMACTNGEDGIKYIPAASAVATIIPLLGCSVMYLYALLKSGSWARDILGG